MALISIETIWMDRIFLFLSIANAAVLLCLLSYQLYKKSKSSTKKKLINKQIRFLNIFSLSTLIFTIAYGVQRSISGQGIGDCTLHVFLGGFFWLTTKLMMYLFFISRLDVAFRYSAFKFSNKLFIFLYILVVIAWITEVLEYAIWGKGILVESETFNITFCGNLSPLFTFIYLACCDAFISTMLTILFVKRLLDAFYVRHNQKLKHITKITMDIARYVTLTIIGVMTTIIALLIFATTSWFTAIALDLIINNHCIFLMYSTNYKYFNCVCGPLHKLIGKCLSFCYKKCRNKDAGDEDDVIAVYDVQQYRTESRTDNTSTETQLEISHNATSPSSAASSEKSGVSADDDQYKE